MIAMQCIATGMAPQAHTYANPSLGPLASRCIPNCSSYLKQSRGGDLECDNSRRRILVSPEVHASVRANHVAVQTYGGVPRTATGIRLIRRHAMSSCRMSHEGLDFALPIDCEPVRSNVFV